jgi:hypothetical protein
VEWIIERQMKLLNFIGNPSLFTKISANKITAGMMKLDALEEFEIGFRQERPFVNQITNSVMSKIITKCPMLRLLDSKGCINSTSSIIQVAQSCPMLESFYLWECPAITDVAIISIAECCLLLQSLHLVLCPDITDATIIRVAECCPKLNDLKLINCPVTDVATIRTVECARYCRFTCTAPQLQKLPSSE